MGSISLSTKTLGKNLIAGIPDGMTSATLAGLFMLLMCSLELGWLNYLLPTVIPDFVSYISQKFLVGKIVSNLCIGRCFYVR